MAKRRWMRRLRRAAVRGDVVTTRHLLRHVVKWREVELQSALNLVSTVGVVRVFVEEASVFWHDGGAARATVSAAAAGREAQLRALLAAGADPQAGRGSFEGETALHAASEAGHEGCVRALLDAGADHRARCSAQWTPLHWAAHGGRAGCALLLLAAGADPKACDFLDRTPLHWAASCGYEEVLRILLLMDSGLDFRDYIGQTPLHLAATGVWEVDWSSQLPDKSDWDAPTNHMVCIRAMVESGADLEVADHQGKTALLVGAQAGYTAGCQVLLELGANLMVVATDGQTALHMACRSANRACIREFLLRGINVQSSAQDGSQPLHVAAEQALAEETIEELVAAGAQVEARDAIGRTALHYAAARMCSEGVETLLHYGVDINAGDALGRTALHEAAPHWPAMIRLLVAHGASVDTRDATGVTALHAAASAEYPTEECVRALLEAGANRTVRDEEGRTPADVASLPAINSLLKCWALAG